MGSLKNIYKRSFGRFIILAFIVSLFISCGRKNSRNDSLYVLHSSSGKNVPDYVLLNEAKYSDVPVPIGFNYVNRPMVNQADKDIKSDFLSYQGSLDLVSALSFYFKALEVEGWQIEDLSNNYEGLLFCSKPDRKCVISLRNIDKDKINIYIFVKNKLNILEGSIIDESDINSKNVIELKKDLDKDFNFNTV